MDIKNWRKIRNEPRSRLIYFDRNKYLDEEARLVERELDVMIRFVRMYVILHHYIASNCVFVYQSYKKKDSNEK